MSILTLPFEIFQQVLSGTITFSYENFISLRLVHSQFDNTIRASAEYLVKKLVHARNVPEHVLSLHQHFDGSRSGTNRAEQKLSSLLRLYKDVATCIQLEELLDAHREKFAAISIWADVPAKGFGSFQSVLVFSAFQRELMRSIEVCDEADLALIARADADNKDFEWPKLDGSFMDFVRVQMSVDDLQALMTIVNFCAISIRFIDTILKSRYYFNNTGGSGHWHNEQLESALLAERILWRGPSWLAKTLHQNFETNTQAIPLRQHATLAAHDDHIMWAGSRAEVEKLTANGVARFLWKERARKLEIERIGAERYDGEPNSGPYPRLRSFRIHDES